jgi:Tfp pilus assembly protein PilX
MFQGWYLEMNKLLNNNNFLKDKFLEEKNNKGWILITVIVMTLLLSAIGLSIAGLSSSQYQHTTFEVYNQNAQLVAEAGVEQTVYELNANSSFSGYSTAQQFFNNTTQGYSTYTTTVTNDSSDNAKTILSTGKLYFKSSSPTPYLTRQVKVTVVGTTSTGYSVFSGPGGLILSGSANITNSNVYVGGTITLSGASKIGTASNPVTVNVANDACPTGSNPGSTYPQVCSSSNQPISLAQSTAIYGTVCATGQTTSGPNNNIQGGNGGSGLQAGCTTPVSSPPGYSRSAQISAVTTTASGSSNNYVCNSSPFNRTWTSNLELTGNVSIGGSCIVTVTGNVYITGNLSIGGSSQINVANSAGSTPPVIIVDGTISVGGSAAMVSNSSGTGIEFISFDSAASCGASCTSISGNDLYNSQKLQTIDLSGASNLPGMVFDAYWGEVTLSGSGKVGALAGQTVNLSGAGTVIFGTQLSSGSQTWSITSYQPLE